MCCELAMEYTAMGMRGVGCRLSAGWQLYSVMPVRIAMNIYQHTCDQAQAKRSQGETAGAQALSLLCSGHREAMAAAASLRPQKLRQPPLPPTLLA
jgi:hypothetical protein